MTNFSVINCSVIGHESYEVAGNAFYIENGEVIIANLEIINSAFVRSVFYLFKSRVDANNLQLAYITMENIFFALKSTLKLSKSLIRDLKTSRTLQISIFS